MVSSTGVVTAKKAGTAYIFAKSKANPIYADSVQITVINAGTVGNNNTISIIQGGSMQLTSKFGTNVLWNSTAPATTLTITATGYLSIPMSTPVGSSGSVVAYNMSTGDSEQFYVVVTQKPIDNTVITKYMTVGQSMLVDPTTFTKSSSTTWSAYPTTVITVNPTNGTVTANGAGTGTLTISSNTYPNVTQTMTIIVTGTSTPNASVTLNSLYTNISADENLTFTVTSNVNGIVYLSATGEGSSKVSISPTQNNLVANNPLTATLSVTGSITTSTNVIIVATFTPIGSTTPISTTKSITINPY
jgi:hypothetical protein